MRVVGPPSPRFDPAVVRNPSSTGEMDWSGFNSSFDWLLRTHWREVNAHVSCPFPKRLLRLWLAFVQQRRNAILDFEGKLRTLWRLRLPPNPSIVQFGAEAGWEAALVQALYGNQGRALLIDSDPMAYQRFMTAPRHVRVRAPKGSGRRWIDVYRDPARFEYSRDDFFKMEPPGSFDVGLDWGLIEHYDDRGKQSLIALFRRFLKTEGIQVSSCPRDRVSVRLFYAAFSDELNFGYRELMKLHELAAHIRRAGCHITSQHRLAAHNVVAYRFA